MDIILWKFFNSIIIGILIAVPIGPISVMCIKYALRQSLIAGCIVGLGAGIVDVIYAAIAGISLDMVNDSIAWSKNILKIVGGVFLIAISVRSIVKDKALRLDSKDNKNQLHDSNHYIFAIAFLTNLFNPITIILFVSLFAGANIDLDHPLEYFLVPFGVFIGSVGWMLAVAFFIHHVKHKITTKVAYQINFFSNILVAFFGVLSIYSGTFSILC